jgi:hypothetical protein
LDEQPAIESRAWAPRSRLFHPPLHGPKRRRRPPKHPRQRRAKRTAQQNQAGSSRAPHTGKSASAAPLASERHRASEAGCRLLGTRPRPRPSAGIPDRPVTAMALARLPTSPCTRIHIILRQPSQPPHRRAVCPADTRHSTVGLSCVASPRLGVEHALRPWLQNHSTRPLIQFRERGELALAQAPPKRVVGLFMN